ncbi:MAG TPA: TCP-1/cpn60 chaperonin family protein [Nitrososphaeraceae archaeon]|nr:TCP-1/cpn60 chaperonin family protein [Nitrososphaeraceae archaeon]
MVRASLCPRGMNKMLENSLGDVTILNDGATILKEIDVQHLAAKKMVEVAKSAYNEVGGGYGGSMAPAACKAWICRMKSNNSSLLSFYFKWL